MKYYIKYDTGSGIDIYEVYENADGNIVDKRIHTEDSDPSEFDFGVSSYADEEVWADSWRGRNINGNSFTVLTEDEYFLEMI